MKKVLVVLIICSVFSCSDKSPDPENPFQAGQMMIRVAEIEIEDGFIQEYTQILKEESEASLRLEPGVIAIFPMVLSDDPYKIRIVEIYADEAAYEAHLQSPHFQDYKTSTGKMINSLKLMDMHAIDPGSMPVIFRKLN